MQRDKVAQKAREAVESAIVQLHNEREKIDEELAFLVAMLKAGEPKAKKAKRQGSKSSPTEAAIRMLGQGLEVTPISLSEKTGQSPKLAAQTLAYLVQTGRAKRVRLGVYARGAR